MSYDIEEPGSFYFSLDAKHSTNSFLNEIYNNKSVYLFAPHLFHIDSKTPE